LKTYPEERSLERNGLGAHFIAADQMIENNIFVIVALVEDKWALSRFLAVRNFRNKNSVKRTRKKGKVGGK
jgi:hypothetical protein